MATVDLGKLKQERTIIRRIFTRKVNDIKKLVENVEFDHEGVMAVMEVLEPRVQTMFDLDEQIYNILLQSGDEGAIEADVDQADNYRLEWVMLKKRIEKVYPLKIDRMNYSFKSVSSCNDHNENTDLSVAENKRTRKYNLPKLEMKKFDGNIKNWLSFWGQFKKIDQDEDMDDDDKYQYLLQSMEFGTEVRAIVESFPPSGVNYRHALDQLKARFARDDILIEVYVRELLNLVLLQAKGNHLSLTTLYDQISAQIRALESLGVTKEKYSAFIYPMLESALPCEILKIWERSRPALHKSESADKDLSNLLLFLKREVDSEQRVNMARSSFKVATGRINNPEIPAAECLIDNIKKPDVKQCIFCEKTSHGSIECNKLEKMSIEQRKDFLIKKKACIICLKVGHIARFCRAYTKCCICFKRHSVILCSGKREETSTSPPSANDTVSNSTAQSRCVTLLQTLVVTIINGEKQITVRALFDSGAQRSYLKKSVAESLGLKPVTKESLSHFLFGGIQTKSEEHDVYDFTIQSLDKSFNFKLSALSQNRICGNIPFVDLRDVTLSNMLKENNVSLTDKGIDNSAIGLLIGADFMGRFMTKEFLCLQNGLTAIRTKLGWTIIGQQAGVSCYINSLFCSPGLDTFWSLETLGIRDPIEVQSTQEKEAQVLADFESNVTINEQKRYEVNLPWKTGHENLLSNYNLAKGRLLSTTKRLESLGFTCPVTLVPRLMLQELWQRKVGWDEEIPEDILTRFMKWYEHISYIKNCRIPRRLSNQLLKESKVSLHTFCDASKNSYATCVFLRAEKDDEVSVQLLAAKSRVAPIEKMSIPRLELMSTLIATRLSKEIEKGLDLCLRDKYFWTDSSVALCWIKRELPWNTFVGNRVREIRENSNTDNWHHVPGTLNCADLASRGCDAKQLFGCRWFEGPTWLRLSSENWPRSEVIVDESEAVKEFKKNGLSVNVCVENSFVEKFTYFSSYTKIIRTLAWIMRYLNNIIVRNKKMSGELSYDEFENAEKKMVMLLQTENKDLIEKRCSNMKIFYDEDKLMRVETKLTFGDFSENLKTPLIVPANNFIMRRMVEERHKQLQHAGSNIVIADIRQRFWVIGIRLLVKSVISKCIICRRFSAKRVETATAPLPYDRVNCSAPFEITGVDLAGPLYLRGGEKCWVVLYTCAVYRAVHLELTKSLSTTDFLMTLRRFIARRGRVRVIMSDNGTNFVGANNLFSGIDWNDVHRYSNIVRIKWKFNVPSAPWWGGYWERLIKILKDLLRRVLGKCSVTYEELQTLLCDCEATMNGRPLTYVEDDKASSLEPLTPMCFLHLLPSSDVTDLDQVDSRNLNCRLRYLQKLRDDFKQRFQYEYLTCLLQKGKQKIGDLKIGDVVLIETEEKRLKWPLGLVVDLFKGRDGVCRAAQLKTASGIKERPLKKLYKLEVSIVDFTTKDEKVSGEQQKTRYGRVVKVPSRLNNF